jgi:TonB-dependent starch-binding outer membrane protein SusC
MGRAMSLSKLSNLKTTCKSMTKIPYYHEKLLWLMRITLAQMVILGLFTSLSYANPVAAQKILEQKISLTLKDAPIKEVLAAIEKTSDVRFSYLPKQIQSDKKVDVQFDNVPLRMALDKIFKNTPIEYEAIGAKQILLSRHIPPQYETPEIEVLPKETPVSTVIAPFIVTGVVTAENDELLVGVSVVLEGTQKGAITDEKGAYRLELDDAEKQGNLIFSYVGYLVKKVPIDNKSILNVTMVEDNKS